MARHRRPRRPTTPNGAAHPGGPTALSATETAVAEMAAQKAALGRLVAKTTVNGQDALQRARAALTEQRQTTEDYLDVLMTEGDDDRAASNLYISTRAIVSAIRELALDGRLYTLEQDAREA